MPNTYVNKVVQSNGTVLIDITDTTAVASDVAQGKYFYTASGEKVQGTASGAAVIAVEDELDSHGGTIRHITGVSLLGDTVTAATLLSGVTAHAADGTALTGTYVAPTAKTADDVTVSGATVTVPAGAYSSQVQKSVASGTAGTPTASKGTVSNHAISVTPSVTNTTGYITGSTKTGTAVSVSASELVSGTLTISSSGTKDVTNYASASVAAGTAGTPTASKGTVSNHSISVTPSVTNTAGYISSGTKTGTAVTVSASELVSGSQTITSNGTTDVTNLASVTVAVPIVTYYTGSSAPSSSLGSNGDIYLQTG